ncbi:MAG TPA: hypothetical protein ENJ09_11775 [Planctomycetes bacterium]|nr:hypothetical protein [Planctomycetota bacterium]
MLELAIGLPGAGELVVVYLALGVVSALVLAIPAGRICQKAGFSGWFGALAIFPPFFLFLLWGLALLPWPKEAGGEGVTQG